jgi:hypothetical protein
LLLASVVVLALGAMEDVYGNADSGDLYSSDAVQYLDIARNLERHDWHSALNPLWSQGYPAILAAARPLFATGPHGDWLDTRVVNFAIFAASYGTFLYLLIGLAGKPRDGGRHDQRRSLLLWVGGLSLFTVSQVCLGQVSRVNPDELVTAIFFLLCGLVVRQLRQSASAIRWQRGLMLGALLGIGFLVKAVFLALGAGILVILAIAVWRSRRSLGALLAAALVFACIVGGYGAALSRAVGHRTVGEAGSINYAWHVNRLQKWVHWEGGMQPASEAWPKGWIAHFAQWDTNPPDFGTPLHPSKILQTSPRVYGFSAPIHATYVPYYDPPYWYEGYRHVFRVRYQLIALVKSLADLAQVLLSQPMFYAVLLALVILLQPRHARFYLLRWTAEHWPVVAFGVLGIALYLPVHLEGRYITGPLTLLGLCAIAGASSFLTVGRFRTAVIILVLGLCGSLATTQRPVWHNLMQHRSPANNLQWKIGEAIVAEGVAPLSQVGVISWTANLHSDWAYIANVQITSEIASVSDYNLFWSQSAEEQAHTLETFRRAGAVAVLVNGKPPNAGGPRWKQLADTPMWMYRL